jgi:hypothetical protein
MGDYGHAFSNKVPNRDKVLLPLAALSDGNRGSVAAGTTRFMLRGQ